MTKPIAWIVAVCVCLLSLLTSVAVQAQAPTIAVPGPNSSGRSDMLVPASGLPLVVFQEGSTVKALQCANALCSGAPTSITTIANLSSLTRIRVATAADGLPIVGISVTASGLRAVKCNDAACTSSITTVVDSSNLGFTTDHDLIVPADGLPLFAYYDASNFDLKIARCATPDCTGIASIVVADTAGFTGRGPGVAIIGGLPQVAYHSNPSGTINNVKLLRCGSPDCTVGNTTSVLTTDNTASLAMMEGRDGAAIIAYKADVTTQDSLRLVKCLNTSCLTFAVSTVDSISSGSGVGEGVQMRAGADGLPVLSYFDSTFGTIKLARCTRPDCASVTTTTLHAPTPSVALTANALAINGNGVPVVAYGVLVPVGSLRVHSCNTRSCQ